MTDHHSGIAWKDPRMKKALVPKPTNAADTTSAPDDHLGPAASLPAYAVQLDWI
jgi:hypothetical protein